MKFSLVLATVVRVDELKRFLESLEAQRDATFELIVVDQNADDRLVPLLESYAARFPLSHVRSERGLSRARNAGLKHIAGDIVAFPDDDCWYPEGLLCRADQFFAVNPGCDGLTGRAAVAQDMPQRGWGEEPGWLTKENVWERGISWTIFLRQEVVRSVGAFDETLGVGSCTGWGSAEETDYLLAALEQKFNFFYDPSLLVCHPALEAGYDSSSRRKAFSYAKGMGRVLKKREYSPLQTWGHVLLPLRGVVYSLATCRPRRALHRWASFRGRLAGYRAKPSPEKR